MTSRFLAVLPLVLAVGQLRGNAQESTPPSAKQYEASGIQTLAIKSSEVRDLLKSAIEEMAKADREVKEFVKKKGPEKKKAHFWGVSEITKGPEVTVMRVDFYSETGPASFAEKRVYEDESYTGERREKGFTLYYYENGNPKMFLTRGDSATVLKFYESGKIKEFGIAQGDETVAEIRCGENGSVDFEKWIPPGSREQKRDQ